MKINKIILLIVVILFIMNINSKSYAKYVYEYIQTAAEIRINN